MKISIQKRIVMLFLVSMITFLSVFSAYQKTTEAAEWVAGTIAAIGGSGLMTALVVGGVVVAGGIAIYELSQTDSNDFQEFGSYLKNGFNEFVSEQEKQIALENDSSLTDQQAADIGVANAREVVNNFWDSAITTVKDTTQDMRVKAQEYWNLYSSIIQGLADNGLPNGESVSAPITISQNVPIAVSAVPKVTSITLLDSILNNKYIYRGSYIKSQYLNEDFSVQTGTWTSNINNPSNAYIPYQTIIITGSDINLTSIDYRLYSMVVDRSNGNYLNNILERTYNWTYSEMGSRSPSEFLNYLIAMTSLPTIVKFQDYNYVTNPSYLYVNSNGNIVKNYERNINDALTKTKVGKAISTGRQELVKDGDYVAPLFKDNTTVAKKQGLQIQDGVASAQVGWNIPKNAWDDYLKGVITWPELVRLLGAIGVPNDSIDENVDDPPIVGPGVIEWPSDETLVQDTAGYPEDSDEPEELPEKPTPEIEADQGGSFYPNAFDLTQIFPFCIPFDIIYLVEKFDAYGEEAPVITIPIVYPQVLQGALGESYEVTIDFEDFIVVRNVLRVFLLLLFIIGLMQITRNLIRG